MRILAFVNAMFGVASAVVLAGACSDFNGVEPPEAGAAADSAATNDGAIPGTADDASSSSSSGGSKTDSGGDASTWTPKDLVGLTVWLDATVGVNYDTSNAVTGWKDQSGQLNNATLIVPCLNMNGNITTCLGPLKDAASLNGHDTLQFGTSVTGDRRYLSIADNASLQFGTGDFAVFEVVRLTSGTSPLWTKYSNPVGDPSADHLGFSVYGADTMFAYDQYKPGVQGVRSVTSGLADDTFRRLGSARRGGVLQLWVNGAADAKVTLTTVADVSTPGVPVRVGGPGVQAFAGGLIGGVAEVVAVKGTITDADVAKLDAYFKTKWGL